MSPSLRNRWGSAGRSAWAGGPFYLLASSAQTRPSEARLPRAASHLGGSTSGGDRYYSTNSDAPMPAKVPYKESCAKKLRQNPR